MTSTDHSGHTVCAHCGACLSCGQAHRRDCELVSVREKLYGAFVSAELMFLVAYILYCIRYNAFPWKIPWI